MFNLVENAGDNAGYELRIGYDVESHKFYVTGYIIFKDGKHDYEKRRDGATRWFNSMDEAVRFMMEYEEEHHEQLKFDFEKDINAKHE